MAQYDTLIIDGSSYLFRAYHALPNLTNRDGEPTGAIYGVINMLMKLKRSQACENFLVVFDAPGGNFRHDLYPDYKANRGAMPEDLVGQIEPLYTIIRHMGWPMVSIPGVEADDVIATVAKAQAKMGKRVLISTGDKDLAQLVNEQVHLINTMKDEVLDIEGVHKKFGIGPDQILDYLMLIGDSSDNIPGVNKVGPKTAVKWLTEYKTLENLVANADNIKGVVGQNLRDSLDQFEWTRELVRLKDDVELSISDADMQMADANSNDLQEIFMGLDFTRWANEIKDKEREIELKSVLHLDSDADVAFQANEAIAMAIQDKIIVFADKIWMVDSWAMAIAKGELTFVNAKTVMAQLGDKKNFDDLSLMHYVAHSAQAPASMDEWLLAVTGRQMGKEAQLVLEGTFSQSGLSELHELLWEMREKLKDELDAPMQKVYALEKAVLPVIVQLETNGVYINKDKLKNLDAHYKEVLLELQEKIFDQTGVRFNLHSPKQMREVLFDQMQLPILEKTSKGIPSTSEATLSELAKTVPVAQDIMSHRMYAKLKSTYSDALLQLLSEHDRIHGQFIQTGTNTGRLSSRHPNLQNIPVKTQEGRKIRQCFEAPAGWCIMSIDYSQIELRLVAHLAQDKQLIASLNAGEDIHAAVASRIFQVPTAEVSSSMRRKAKAINFGIIYGISAFGLSKQLDVTPKEAKEIIDSYFAGFSEIQALMQKSIEQAQSTGSVRTTLGRRIKIAGISDKNAIRRQGARRVAINAPIQGMAADIMKLAMVEIEDYLQTTDNVKMVLQVHDELVFEVKSEHAQQVGKELARRMEQVVKLDVPLVVSVGMGENWDEAH